MIVVLKQGIITIKDGYELVWELGLYGEHEYIVENRVTDSIKQVDDAQVIYWYFVIHGFLSGVYRGVNKMKKLKRVLMKYKGQYTNEIPYDGEFYEVYQLLFDTKLCKLDNLMAAYILKWMKEKRIKVEHETVEGLFKRKQKVTIQILRKNLIDDIHESDLFSNLSVVVDVAGKV